MESSKNPLLYFESFIEINNILKLRDDYIREAIEELNSFIVNIDVENGIITYRNSYHDYDKDGNNSATFERRLSYVLFPEFQKTKSLIDNLVQNNPNNYLPFLYLIEKNLQYIINRGHESIVKFPLLLKPVLGIEKYINEKYLYDQEKKLSINISLLTSLETEEGVKFDDNELINNILSYLKGHNDKREKIMSDEQYNLMIYYVNYFIENNTAPENIQKISSLNKKISKNLLRFTFWVLHKYLWTTTPIKDNFLHFVKSMFSDFDDWEFSTLKTKFGNRDKVTIFGKKFIPEIIKIEHRSKR